MLKLLFLSIILISFANPSSSSSSSSSDYDFSFGVITDTHIGFVESKREEYFQKVISTIKKGGRGGNLSFVIHLGDLTHNGKEYQIENAQKLLNELDIPYYLIIATHDLGNFQESENVWFEKFSDEMEMNSWNYTGKKSEIVYFNDTYRNDGIKIERNVTVYYQNFVIKKDKIVFIGLDWSYHYQGKVGIINYTKNWLEGILKDIDYESIEQIVFLQHYPFVFPILEGLSWDFNKNEVGEFVDLLKKYGGNYTDKYSNILCGHLHLQFKTYPFKKYGLPNLRQFIIQASDGDSSFYIFRVKDNKFVKIEHHYARIFDWSFIVPEFLGYIIFILLFLYNIYLIPIQTKSLIPVLQLLFNIFYFGAIMYHHQEAKYFSALNFEQGFLEFYIFSQHGMLPSIIAFYMSILLFFVMNLTSFYLQTSIVIQSFLDSLFFLLFVIGVFHIQSENGIMRFRNHDFLQFRSSAYFMFCIWYIFCYSFTLRLLLLIVKQLGECCKFFKKKNKKKNKEENQEKQSLLCNKSKKGNNEEERIVINDFKSYFKVYLKILKNWKLNTIEVFVALLVIPLSLLLLYAIYVLRGYVFVFLSMKKPYYHWIFDILQIILIIFIVIMYFVVNHKKLIISLKTNRKMNQFHVMFLIFTITCNLWSMLVCLIKFPSKFHLILFNILVMIVQIFIFGIPLYKKGRMINNEKKPDQVLNSFVMNKKQLSDSSPKTKSSGKEVPILEIERL